MKSNLLFYIFFSLAVFATAQTKAIQKRNVMLEEILQQTEDHICNPAFLETAAWETFTKEIYQPEVLALNDLEFARAFNRAAAKLPFSHYYLMLTDKKRSRKARKKAKARGPIKAFEFEVLDETTAVLTIRQFISNSSLMHEMIAKIQEGGYEKLIIDLRGNRGGTLDAAVVLGQYLTPKMIDAGSYLSRSWFEEKGRYPLQEEIEIFPFLRDMSYAGFQEAAQNPAFRMVLPPHQNATFQGKVYVLTDKRTASTCEPFVHLLKEQGVAEVVGEKTAGAMLSGATFKLTNKLKLFMPVQDYVTANGTRLDKIGVTPTTAVPSDEAMDKVLEMIQNKA